MYNKKCAHDASPALPVFVTTPQDTSQENKFGLGFPRTDRTFYVNIPTGEDTLYLEGKRKKMCSLVYKPMGCGIIYMLGGADVKLSKRKLRNAKLAAREAGTIEELKRKKWARLAGVEQAREDAPAVQVEKRILQWTEGGRQHLRETRQENGGRRVKYSAGPGSLVRVVKNFSPLRVGDMVMLVSEPGPGYWDSDRDECEVLLGSALVVNVPMRCLRPLDD